MKIELRTPGGERPLINKHLLDDQEASFAENVRLESGGLQSWESFSEEEVISELPNAYTTLYKYQGDWLTWVEDVDIATSPIANDTHERIYFTGEGVPKVMSKASTSISYPLGVAPPSISPPLSKSGTSGSTPTTFYYTWTFVTSFGEQGSPSAVSSIANVTDTETVTITGFPVQPTGKNISGFYLYRMSDQVAGEFFFVQAFEYDNAGAVKNPGGSGVITTWDDTVANANLGETLITDDWDAPPTGLSGLINMPGGFLAGFVGNTVHFSESWYPHAWPYSISIHDNIIGLAVSGSTLIILTDKSPYLAVGGHPENMSIIKAGDPLPCVSKRSITQLEGGVFYASALGLAYGNSDRGSFRILTREILSKANWEALYPSSIHAVTYDRKYFGFYEDANGDGGGFIIDFDLDRARFTRLDFYPLAHYTDHLNNILYLLIHNDNDQTILIKWGEGEIKGVFYYTWTSKLFLLPKGINFGAVRAIADWPLEDTSEAVEAYNQNLITTETEKGSLCSYQVGFLGLGMTDLQEPPSLSGSVLLTLYDGDEIKATRSLNSNSVVRIPSGFKYKNFKYKVEGNALLRNLEIATGVTELK